MLELYASDMEKNLADVTLEEAGAFYARQDSVVSRQTLTAKLQESGWIVMESNDRLGAHAKRILVGREMADGLLNSKQLFYGIVEKLGLVYNSGAYFTVNPTERL